MGGVAGGLTVLREGGQLSLLHLTPAPGAGLLTGTEQRPEMGPPRPHHWKAFKEGNEAVVVTQQQGTEFTPLEIAQRASSVVYGCLPVK